MSLRSASFLFLGASCILIALSGCGRHGNLSQDEGLLGVEYSLPVSRDVTDYEDFTGRLDAVFSVEVKPQVTGKLLTMKFTEGAEVKKGDLLFEIDPEQYEAQYNVGLADVVLAKAKLVLAIADNRRAKAIYADNRAAISLQDLDKYDASEKEARAAVDSAKSKMTSYEINLKWCKLYSDINGQISRYNLTTGNLVNQNQTLLTTVVSVDPIYAYFDMDERTLLRVRDALRRKKIRVPESGADLALAFVAAAGEAGGLPHLWQVGWTFGTIIIPIYIGLANETGFPHEGTINFVNNRLDPLTGTIQVRGLFSNPVISDNRRRLMSPGMFVRIRIPLSNPYRALLVAEKVILTDQGLKKVYVLDANDKVRERQVIVGAAQSDGLRVVTGIEKNDKIVVSNLQQLYEGMEVKAEKIPMPVVVVPVQSDGN